VPSLLPLHESEHPEELVTLNFRGLGTGYRPVWLSFAALLLLGALTLAPGGLVPKIPVSAVNHLISASRIASDRAPGLQSASGKVPLGKLALGQLPLRFEPNEGQTDPQVKFLARGAGFGLFLTPDQAVLTLGVRRKSTSVSMRLAGAKSGAVLTGNDRLPGKSNYFIGNNPAQWHSNVPQFARVRYQSVYPGVDLVYYGKQGQLEYDFEVAPGADPAQVALKFQGADQLSLDSNGDLVLGMNGGEMRLEAPRVYQRVGEERTRVSGKFVLQADRQVGFEIGAYDRSRALVIDPVLTYSTFLGGSGNESLPHIAVDAGLNAYVAGTTVSADFPIVASSTTVLGLQNCLNDSAQPTPALGSCPSPGTASDVFIAKFDASGTVLLFSTYLGGSGDDSAGGVAVDSGLNVIVAGATTSNDLIEARSFR